MDKFNPSHSAGTYWLMRAEHLLVVIVCAGLLIFHIRELNLWHFFIAFILIDVAGYLPGLIAWLRAGKRPIAPTLHYLYNFFHSYITWAVVILVWYLASGWEWAMLAVPLHLSGDRGIFGNVFKPSARSFEPVRHVE